MPTNRVKVAVSLPREVYRQVEKSRKRLRISRSAVISNALKSWTASSREQEKIRAYVEGYRRSPETSQEQRLFGSLAGEILATEDWKP